MRGLPCFKGFVMSGRCKSWSPLGKAKMTERTDDDDRGMDRGMGLKSAWSDRVQPLSPGLIIAGGRGWKNEEVFDRLDALPANGPICEAAGLSDGALAALVEQSAGVLFSSHAEGFGLPATEAAARGVPIIVNDLQVLRELLGDIPIYACVSDRYLWIDKINELAGVRPNARRQQPFVPPTWDALFKTVLRLT